MSASEPGRPTAPAVIFDLDGVLTDTAELHYQSWQEIADKLRIPFDRQANEALRGLGRSESLQRVLGPRWYSFTPSQRDDLMHAKNEAYLRRVAQMSPRDLFPGVADLLRDLRRAGAKLAIASSSRNSLAVIERLGIRPSFDAIVDGNDAPRSKPDPQVFLVAAQRLGARPTECVVIEDAEAGVAAARAAGMRVVGIGPHERVGAADLRVPTPAELRAAAVLGLLDG
jgi:kojibiose phosphorylase